MEIVRAGSKSKPVKIIDVDFDTLVDINKDHRFYDQEEKAICIIGLMEKQCTGGIDLSLKM